MVVVHERGHGIHFVRKGEAGRPTLLLHSTGVGSIQWLRFARRLKDRVCFIPDFMNYPPSDAWSGEGPPDWRVDLEACRTLVLSQSEPVDIIGHSYGGHIALHLAHDHPDRIRKMALHEPIAWGVFQDAGPPAMQEAFGTLRQRFFPEPPLSVEAWLLKFVDYWNGDGAWAALSEKRRQTWRDRFQKIHYEVRHLCFDPYTLDHWATMTTPTCITVSEHATPEEATACALLAERIPSVHCLPTPGGHLAPMTHSADVLPVLAAAIDAPLPQRSARVP